MSATNFLDSFFHLYCHNLSEEEKNRLEAVLFFNLYEELIMFYEVTNNYKKEDAMNNALVIRGLVKELLATNEYSLEGIAYYTGYPEDVISDIVAGININPTLTLSAKIIELHASSRRDFYNDLVKKVIKKY